MLRIHSAQAGCGGAKREGWANSAAVCSLDWAERSRVKISGCQQRGVHLQSTVTPFNVTCVTNSTLAKPGLLVQSEAVEQ